MYSNANYLTNPNKLSTKVHYAPGGASSLSLAWDNTPMPNRNERNRPQNNYSQRTEPAQNYSQPRQNGNYYPPQQQQQPYSPPLQQQQQQYSSPHDDSNRILEAELQYYQNRNKLIGGYEPEQPYRPQYTPPANQYTPPANQYSQQYYGQQQQFQEPKYAQRPEELDLAIQQHRKRQESSSSQHYGHYPGSVQEKTSVRVNNPPGGRSNIVFG